MSDVNILIVGDRNTEKFKFSVKNRYDIRFIKAESIIKIHSIWLNNEDQSDPNLLKIENYLLPIFENFTICLSRVVNDKSHPNEDFSKQNLVNIIKENGGAVSDSLTTTSSCVITNEKSGKRYDMAKKWQIPIIHPLWIIHSLKRKASLDFDYYNIELVKDYSKIGEKSCLVWDELLKPRTRKKIVLDEHEDQEPILKKDPKIWNSIMQVANIKSNKPHQKVETSWDEEDEEEQVVTNPVKLEITKSMSKIPELDSTKSKISPIVTSNLFKDLTFQIELFDSLKKSTLSKVIESHSGEIVEDLNPSFLIIPSDFPLENLPSPLQSKKDLLVTEWFIERCLHYKSIKSDHWGKPFYYSRINSPLDLNISITGFQGIELLHLTKIISLLQFNLHESLNNDRDLLILNIDLLNLDHQHHLFQRFPSLFNSQKHDIHRTNTNSTKKKIKFAKQKNIPILTITYLFTIFQIGKIPNINQRDWCVYCPKFANLRKSLQILVDTTDNHTSNKPELTSPKKDQLTKQPSLPKLPSPIRNKRKDNWGRLVGRASKSQLNSLELENPDNQQQDKDINDQIPDSTQISYGNSETNVKLLRLLNREIEDPKKSNEAHDKLEPPRKRTRAGYKEMLDVLDHD